MIRTRPVGGPDDLPGRIESGGTVRRRHLPARRPSGHSLIEITIALVVISVVAAIALPATSAVDRWALTRAARLTERQLANARILAVARRDRIRLRVVGGGTLESLDGAGTIVDRRVLAGGRPGLVDSVTIRPASIRFNPRGHGAAGSIYLYRNGRGIRVISNFVGRIRRHSFRF